MLLKPHLRLRQRATRTLHDRVDRAAREPAAEELPAQLDRVAAGDAVPDRQGGDGRLEAGTEGAAGNAGRQLGARLCGTGRAAQPVQAMLAQRDRDRWQLSDLVALDGSGIHALAGAEDPCARLAALGPVLDQLVHQRERARLLERIEPLEHELRTLLEQAAHKSTKTKYHRLFAKNLLKRWPALWTFTLLDGVQPTNNHAERGLRGAVIYRKLSLGSQSEQSERTIERLLSASVTCRLQGRSLLAYLTDILSASIRGDPIPALA